MAAVVLTAALTMPVGLVGHTVEQLQEWETDWQSRAVGTFDVKLLEEWRDMRARHPWFYASDEVAISTAARVTTNSVPIAHELIGGVEQWRALVAYFWPAEHVDRALRVMACESGGDPNAYNPSGASGLMQVLASWADNFGLTPTQLFDPATNLQVARWLWDDGERRVGNGWVHWVCA